MIPALLAVWPGVSLAAALILGRGIRRADDAEQEPDWLWDAPTDVLSDAAVDARFAEIAAHFTVRQ